MMRIHAYFFFSKEYGDQMMNNFFEKYNSQERKLFLETSNINYLFFGPGEKKIANNFDPDKENFLQKVYSNNKTAVYKID